MHRRTKEGMSKAEVIRCLKPLCRSGDLLLPTVLPRSSSKHSLTCIGASSSHGSLSQKVGTLNRKADNPRIEGLVEM